MPLDEAEALHHARRAYLDLGRPDYGFFHAAPAQRPYRSVITEFGEFLRTEDWTHDDCVGYWYELTTGRRARCAWSLWLSAVGPYGLLAHGCGEIRRSDVITAPRPDCPPQEPRILDILLRAGVHLLSAADVERTVPTFEHPDGRFPVSMFVLLFGDGDVPWWHVD